jgi:hypothetical protein
VISTRECLVYRLDQPQLVRNGGKRVNANAVDAIAYTHLYLIEFI